MEETKYLNKTAPSSPAKFQSIINAYIYDSSNLNTSLTLKNICTYYMHCYFELVSNPAQWKRFRPSLIKCHELLLQLISDNKVSIPHEIRSTLNEFTIESQEIKTQLEKIHSKREYFKSLKAVIEAKQFTMDYLVTSIMDNLIFFKSPNVKK